MPELHISKVAVGCRTLAALQKRVEARRKGDVVPIVTRFRPKRADELVGGSIYWIIKHSVVARQTILGFATREADRRTIIQLDAALIPVQAIPKRAHQGWRYLAAADAPVDYEGGDDEMPPELASKLSVLALI